MHAVPLPYRRLLYCKADCLQRAAVVRDSGPITCARACDCAEQRLELVDDGRPLDVKAGDDDEVLHVQDQDLRYTHAVQLTCSFGCSVIARLVGHGWHA